jgi:hypothetical protein
MGSPFAVAPVPVNGGGTVASAAPPAMAMAVNAPGSWDATGDGGRAIDPVATSSVLIVARTASGTAFRTVSLP